MRIRMVILCAWFAAISTAALAADDWQAQVAQALGKSGTAVPGGIYRVSLPRTDLKVTLDGVDIKPGFALGGWLAFEKTGAQAMLMGDLVLTEEEVNPVMTKLLAGGIEVTAVHNHLLRNRPFTMYMHVLGNGDPVKLATALRTALAESKTPMAAAGTPAAPLAIDFDTAAVDRALAATGSNNGGIYQFGIPRGGPIEEDGMTVPAAMGLATAVNFQPTGGGKAAITGDFVLIAKEVAPVMKTLRERGIEVTALHNHMIDERPRLYFMHFWAHDDATTLAQGLRAALDRTDTARQ
jgi:Domain of Unknown Function (DUF1259)